MESYYNQAGLMIKQTMPGLYNQDYFYDTYGRVNSESINRWQNGTQKRKQYEYNSLGWVRKVITDNVTEEVTSWETNPASNQTKASRITVNGQKNFDISTQFTLLGTTRTSTDKDGYRYENIYDRYMNVIRTYKYNRSDAEVYQKTSTYDETDLYLDTDLTESSLGINKETAYQYDTYGRAWNIRNYDKGLSDSTLISNKTIVYHDNGQPSEVITVSDSNSAHIQYAYHEDGSLKEITYPNGKKYQYQDDYNTGNKDGRLRGTRYNDEPIVSNIHYYNEPNGTYRPTGLVNDYTSGSGIKKSQHYDALGRLTEKTYDKGYSPLLKQAYTYDLAGNITTINETGDGLTGYFTRGFEYDRYNRLINASYQGKVMRKITPKLSYLPYDYDPETGAANEINNLSTDNDSIQNIEARSSSLLISDASGLGQNVNPKLVKLNKAAGTQLNQAKIIPYYYDNNSFTKADTQCTIDASSDPNYFILSDWQNVETQALKLNFVPDPSDKDDAPIINADLNKKLVEMVEFYADVEYIELSYSYDIMGNRLTQGENIYGPGKSALLSTEETTYQYEDERILMSDTKYTYEYDLDGYLVKKTSKSEPSVYWTYTWDAAGSLRRAEKSDGYYEEYSYDEGGIRLKTVTPKGTTDYVYNGSSLIYEQGAGKTKCYLYAFDELQAVVESDGTTDNYAFYNADVLGTTRFIADADSNILQETMCEPFGQDLLNTDKTQDGKKGYFYAGHPGMDEETGMTYMKARWMDNSTGRFISPDPAQQGLNWYTYCGNNPTTFVDPTGLGIISTITDWINDAVEKAKTEGTGGGGGSGSTTPEKPKKPSLAEIWQQWLDNFKNTFKGTKNKDKPKDKKDKDKKPLQKSDKYTNDELAYYLLLDKSIDKMRNLTFDKMKDLRLRGTNYQDIENKKPGELTSDDLEYLNLIGQLDKLDDFRKSAIPDDIKDLIYKSSLHDLVNLIPGIGGAINVIEAFKGKDLLTELNLDTGERVFRGVVGAIDVALTAFAAYKPVSNCASALKGSLEGYFGSAGKNLANALTAGAKTEANNQLLNIMKNILQQKAGFNTQGTPLIIDNSIGTNPTKLAETLRTNGYNARSVIEIFGKDPKDPAIKQLAEQISGRVVASDRGHNIGGGFQNSLIEVPQSVRQIDTFMKLINDALK